MRPALRIWRLSVKAIPRKILQSCSLLTPDALVKTLAAICLALVTFQGKQILTRLDTLEKNQQAILVELHLRPVAAHTLDSGVKTPPLAYLPGISEIKPVATPQKLW